MIKGNLTQNQGRIKREMLEQQLAVPFDHNSQSLINGLSESLLNKIDRKMLETTPIYKVSAYRDKVMLDHIPPEKLYRTTGLFCPEQYGKDVARSIVEGVAAKVIEPELTLVNGVYE